ncbi:DUF1641 domain-containing protein [Metasolibacillus sp.]|uniref:DUF1641 domain-containing protein n=1 Tax=Metasolibacillus sp. TaxID=2703680 RepID=UPI0025EC61D9|nr:DUF1641 domain-containing protein [Metasolibacillus sp.]MCT6924157.1 DUF1641 domain-containing protein [Metasolibacillus sp.]MCT6940264.1 DUF1641 domain-containing protein [Metasolibacillus sp.]
MGGIKQVAKLISTIKKEELTTEQLQAQKLEDLKQLVANNEDAVKQIFTILTELNDIGALEAASKLIEAKEEVAHIALGQLTRKPITNIMNNLMGVAGALSDMDPATTAKLIDALNSGLDEGNKAVEADEKIGVLQLMKQLKDPDVNRAVNFGVHFLKGLGKGLK